MVEVTEEAAELRCSGTHYSGAETVREWGRAAPTTAGHAGTWGAAGASGEGPADQRVRGAGQRGQGSASPGPSQQGLRVSF